MKTFLGTLALVACGAVMLHAIGSAAAGADASPVAGKPCPGCPRAADNDLQASHLAHMQSMTGRMHGSMPGLDRSMCPDCSCR